MYETLSLMNIRLLLWLNHALAAQPTLYAVALFVTDEGADIALLLTAAWLWFWPDRPRGAANGVPTVETRSDSRARLLMFGAGSIVAYVTARMIALELDMARPFVTYLPVRGNEGAFASLRTFGAFPSDHAALLAALPMAFRYWSRRLAIIWAWMGVFLCLVRIAIGFHYPSDMLAGAAMGVLCAGTAMAVYDRNRVARRATERVALGFAHPRGAHGDDSDGRRDAREIVVAAYELWRNRGWMGSDALWTQVERRFMRHMQGAPDLTVVRPRREAFRLLRQRMEYLGEI